MMWTLAFWKATAERAIKTFCQSAVAVLIVGTGLLGADWLAMLSTAGLAALISVLTSIGSGFVGEHGSPSLAGESLTPAVRPVTNVTNVYSSDTKADAAYHGAEIDMPRGEVLDRLRQSEPVETGGPFPESHFTPLDKP